MSNKSKFAAATRQLAIDTSIAEVTSRLMRNAAPVVAGRLPALTSADKSSPKRTNAKTNPPRPPRPRGLAVARLLAQGQTLTEISRSLRITRQSVWRWSMRPEVKAEIARIHTELVRCDARAR